MKQVHTAIDFKWLVPSGTEFATYDLLQTVGTMTIQTLSGEMVTVTIHKPFIVNGVDFSYSTDHDKITVRDINNNIVGTIQPDYECETSYISLSGGYEDDISELYRQTDEQNAHYIAAISFN